MKITVDTNVLVSATFWYGASNEIISRVESGKIELLLSKEIIEEFRGVLDYKEIRDKIKNKHLEALKTLDTIICISKIISPIKKIDIIKEDPDDNKILECAFAGNVDYIVTQDKHLLKLKEFEGIKIITPKEFLKIIDKITI